MSSFPGIITLCACLLMLFLSLGFGVSISQTLLFRDCQNDTFYDENSTSGRIYRRSLDILLSTLTSNAYRPNGFYNSSVDSPGSDTAIYGLFLCRGDVTTTACQECVSTASNKALGICPHVKIAGFWYEDCMLRYSHHSIINQLDISIKRSLIDYQNLSIVVGDMMDQVSAKAASSGDKFAVAHSGLTFQTLYAFAQCTPDLSNSDCQTCLRVAIDMTPKCCAGRARTILPSCDIRYQTYPSFNQTPPSPGNLLPLSPGNLLPPSPGNLPPPPGSQKGKSRRVPIAIASSIVSSIVVFLVSFAFLKRGSMKRVDTKMPNASGEDDITIPPESLRYSLKEIELATNTFSADNKIGQGGFGGVYKGKLPNGQDIAVKRLSRSSGQGGSEFKNEIKVVAKLQHRNLVRLLGFCLEREEKILVYEFVPNRSLDYFLFDPEKQGLLNWSKRRNIIEGIARGLLYMHEDSRLKIVHRDLKAGNILLDENMHPKIADFGMAKICMIDQSEGNTTRIAGTIGYMAPEYTRSGQYSVKSDVFSFGVVVLEIITGKKNIFFYQTGDCEDLLNYVWQHWRDGDPLTLLDPTAAADSYVQEEIIQNLHIGLLCVEKDAARRPTMGTVVNMLNNNFVNLPAPQCPGIRWNNASENVSQDLGADRVNGKLVPESINMVSITQLGPR